ncbi:MAG: zf-HC2 domain-containing protein [Acidobacteria bacterium]|nr:zf-HC2 domain-containing protein [Acidobacteriota bacterium]
MPQSPHDEFLALCAISTSGELTGEERARLQEHLAGCPSCRAAMAQYDIVVAKTIPGLASDPENLDSDPSWSQDQAEVALFQRLTLDEQLGTDQAGDDERSGSAAKTPGRVPLTASQATWRNVWTLCAAGVLLCIALGVSAYRVGLRRGAASASVSTPSDQANRIALQQQISDAGHDREVLRSEMAQRDKTIADLRRQLEQHSAEMGRMKLTQTQLEADLSSGQAGRQDLVQQRSELSQTLEVAQARTQGLQDRLDSLERQSSQGKQREIALEAKVADLTRLLRDREVALDQQQELLNHDRDIRDVIGARDLYVVEVYDVAGTGKTNKPYARMFYTKDKSVVFYAYDLDKQPGVKNASTFQAWGRRGSDWQQALSLGIFYVDNASKKRWVLKFDDPKALAQIDAVFVTVEPSGGSHKPTNKPLLFAYLHMDPNHP